MKKILVIDDEPNIVSVIQTLMKSEGYDCLTASDGDQGLRSFEFHRPDLVILDWQMPGMNGIDVCTQIRQSSIADPYILMLTARESSDDRLDGFSSGADDYMTKPFVPKELAVRVRALLRREFRHIEDNGVSMIQTPRLQINTEFFTVAIRSTGEDEFVPIKDLPTLQFNLLVTLAQHPGRVYSRDDLLSIVWKDDFCGNDRVVDVYIKELRARLKGSAFEPFDKFIKTRIGQGYFFEDCP